MIKSIFWHWLPFAVLATCVAVLVYAATQQNLRLTANDPQISLAEDTAAILVRGGPTEFHFTNEYSIDIAKSLTTFMVVYSSTGTPLTSSGIFKGKAPVPPPGTFEYAKQHGEDRFTWQPAPDVRIAAVLRSFNGASSGYVLAGRSLREVEKRVDHIRNITFIAWLVTLVLTALVITLKRVYKPIHP